MYDEDYQTYIKAHFDAERRTQRSWTLDPPDQIFDHTKLIGMFDVPILHANVLYLECRLGLVPKL